MARRLNICRRVFVVCDEKDQSKNQQNVLLNVTAKKQRFKIHIKDLKMYLDADVNLAEAVNAL